MDIFFFGSLRDHSLLEVVLERTVDPRDLAPAFVTDRATLKVENEDYPYLASQSGARADGVLLRGAGADDVARLEYFEEAEYALQPITVETADGPVDARHFAASAKGARGSEPWSFATWMAEDRAVAIEAARELISHRTITPVEDMDNIWPGIKIRALMRARAKAEQPAYGSLRRQDTQRDVESVKISRPYTRYFAIEDHHLRHRRFDGSMSEEIIRTALVSGDAVTVVPFDPRTGKVLLIEQFRAPMFARGDACPWGIETIAGRIDKEASAEETARREAMEEAGLVLGRIETVADYYSSPGIASEHLTAFVAEADLSASGGLYGEPTENEDIRAFALPLDEALAAIETSEINNGPAILTLFWLGLHRQRLTQLWR